MTYCAYRSSSIFVASTSCQSMDYCCRRNLCASDMSLRVRPGHRWTKTSHSRKNNKADWLFYTLYLTRKLAFSGIYAPPAQKGQRHHRKPQVASFYSFHTIHIDSSLPDHSIEAFLVWKLSAFGACLSEIMHCSKLENFHKIRILSYQGHFQNCSWDS